MMNAWPNGPPSMTERSADGAGRFAGFSLGHRRSGQKAANTRRAESHENGVSGEPRRLWESWIGHMALHPAPRSGSRTQIPTRTRVGCLTFFGILMNGRNAEQVELSLIFIVEGARVRERRYPAGMPLLATAV